MTSYFCSLYFSCLFVNYLKETSSFYQISFFLHKQGLWWLVVDRLNNPVSFIYSGALEQWVMDFLLLWDLFFTWTKCRSVSQSWPYVVIHVSFNWREKVQTYFVETENVFNWDFNWNHWLCSFYSVILLIN